MRTWRTGSPGHTNLLAGLAVLLLGFAQNHSTWADVGYFDSNILSCRFALRGEISAADVDAFERTSCRPGQFTLLKLYDSSGGDARAAMSIGRWLRDRNAMIVVEEGAHCYSSCALVYIGGTTRFNYGDIGLHRPYLAGEPRSPDQVQAVVARMREEVTAYVEEMGITPDFFNVMWNTPPSGMRIYAGARIETLVPGNDPLREEIETARDARKHGLTTEEYRRRAAEGKSKCTAKYPNYFDTTKRAVAQHYCQQAFIWGLTESVYNEREALARDACRHSDEVSDEDFDAWEARGLEWENHPAAIEERACIIATMKGLRRP